MDIPFRVEGQEFKDIKAKSEAERLLCPNCTFQLEPSSSSAAKVCCPRCNTWIDIDPSCFGSCIKCHKTRQADDSNCATPSLANSKEANEISPLVKGRVNHRTFFAKFSALIEQACGYLSGKK